MSEPIDINARQPVQLSPGQLTALQNLALKSTGKDVDWISISDARALTDLGYAERNREGWNITPAGHTALASRTPPGAQ
jgi:hypothetical protein